MFDIFRLFQAISKSYTVYIEIPCVGRAVYRIRTLKLDIVRAFNLVWLEVCLARAIIVL
jgi:hypothetical protein